MRLHTIGTELNYYCSYYCMTKYCDDSDEDDEGDIEDLLRYIGPPRLYRHQRDFDSTLGYPGEGPSREYYIRAIHATYPAEHDCPKKIVCRVEGECHIVGHYHRLRPPSKKKKPENKDGKENKPLKGAERRLAEKGFLCATHITGAECAQNHYHCTGQTLASQLSIQYINDTDLTPADLLDDEDEPLPLLDIKDFPTPTVTKTSSAGPIKASPPKPKIETKTVVVAEVVETKDEVKTPTMIWGNPKIQPFPATTDKTIIGQFMYEEMRRLTDEDDFEVCVIVQQLLRRAPRELLLSFTDDNFRKLCDEAAEEVVREFGDDEKKYPTFTPTKVILDDKQPAPSAPKATIGVWADLTTDEDTDAYVDVKYTIPASSTPVASAASHTPVTTQVPGPVPVVQPTTTTQTPGPVPVVQPPAQPQVPGPVPQVVPAQTPAAAPANGDNTIVDTPRALPTWKEFCLQDKLGIALVDGYLEIQHGMVLFLCEVAATLKWYDFPWIHEALVKLLGATEVTTVNSNVPLEYLPEILKTESAVRTETSILGVSLTSSSHRTKITHLLTSLGLKSYYMGSIYPMLARILTTRPDLLKMQSVTSDGKINTRWLNAAIAASTQYNLMYPGWVSNKQVFLNTLVYAMNQSAIFRGTTVKLGAKTVPDFRDLGL
jgi:hypothetical protein